MEPEGLLVSKSYTPTEVYAGEDKYTIVLYMSQTARFRNAVGKIKVQYSGQGTLKGAGGFVKPFVVSFSPQDLVRKPNPNDAEHLEISNISATGSLIHVYYTDTQENEHIEISDISATGALRFLVNVNYYDKSGTSIIYTEQIYSGLNAVWGVGLDWSDSIGGQPVANILDNVSSDLNVYACLDEQFLGYAKSTGGTQWIETNIYATKNIFLEMYYRGDTYYNDRILFGTTNSYYYQAAEYNNRYYYGTNGSEYNGGNWTSGYHLLRYNDENDLFTIDNNLIGGPYTFENNNATIKLLKRPANNRTGCDIYIYWFRLIDKDTNQVVCNLRPVLDSNQVVCFYDTVTEQYFYNSGTGVFDYNV